ncbi:MAG: T9SS type A sorting domain-containing protein [Dysgonamonadaceae bacterium]|jgi:hypothetical protein|nr:T9SS type A sorting domain-containing protein [Dysgonamonadaceae bacterium]
MEMIMKKMIISWLFCLATVYIFGQDVCYYFNDEKVCYEVSATRILVKSETLDIAGLENALQNPVAGSLKNIYVMGGGLFVVEMEDTGREDMWALHRQLSSMEDVVYASLIGGGYPGTGYTNEVLVMLKSEDDYPVLLEYAEIYSIKEIKPDVFNGRHYKLTLPHNPEKDAMQTAIELYETGLFEYVDPNLIHLCPFEWCPYGPELEPPDMNTIVEEEQSIVCYPNPVSDILYIDLEKRTPNKTSASYDIRLYSSLGNLCRQAKAPGGMVEFSISDLSGGIYFLNIYAENASKPEAHKIIVKH